MATMHSWWGTYDGRIILASVHNKSSPNKDEWALHLDNIREILKLAPRFNDAVAFAVTDGGGPNSAQRKRMLDLGIETPKAAVITTSRLARGIVTALSWFGLRVRAFAPDNLGAAFHHLSIPASAHQKLRQEIQEYGQKVDCLSAAAVGEL